MKELGLRVKSKGMESISTKVDSLKVIDMKENG
jgi:hypothetical protein